eukprot:TRINITY_DN66261_c0_g1_i1.p1 TRINITY_DN66261_c0_g1~~TRINITY_DN66261_c0_g1_i1.p1  ORF type:complete len:175 (+),score=31.34 TRINITY_DN66261_c0_g1_i1:50-574(+)
MHLLKGTYSSGGSQEVPRASTRSSVGAPGPVKRPAGVDADDVEGILKQVRRGAGSDGDDASAKISKPAHSMTRVSSEDDMPVAVPKASVRGRYVFSGGGGSEMITGHPGALSDHISAVSPRPMATDFASLRGPPRHHRGGEAAAATGVTSFGTHAAEEMAAECVDTDEFGVAIG